MLLESFSKFLMQWVYLGYQKLTIVISKWKDGSESVDLEASIKNDNFSYIFLKYLVNSSITLHPQSPISLNQVLPPARPCTGRFPWSHNPYNLLEVTFFYFSKKAGPKELYHSVHPCYCATLRRILWGLFLYSRRLICVLS
jgi:hypothetical protein